MKKENKIETLQSGSLFTCKAKLLFTNSTSVLFVLFSWCPLFVIFFVFDSFQVVTRCASYCCQGFSRFYCWWRLLLFWFVSFTHFCFWRDWWRWRWLLTKQIISWDWFCLSGWWLCSRCLCPPITSRLLLGLLLEADWTQALRVHWTEKPTAIGAKAGNKGLLGVVWITVFRAHFDNFMWVFLSSIY